MDYKVTYAGYTVCETDDYSEAYIRYKEQGPYGGFVNAGYPALAAALYDGGWRAADKEQMIEEYRMTSEEADAVCTLMTEIEEREASE